MGTCKLMAPRGDASHAISWKTSPWHRVWLPWGYFEGSGFRIGLLLLAVSTAYLAGARAASAFSTFASRMGAGLLPGLVVSGACRFLRFPRSPVYDAEVGKGERGRVV